MTNSLQTENFKIKKGEDDLERSDFEYWPAWSEHYDYEEIDDIERWGINREYALDKFREYDTGGAHPHYTILDLDHLPLDNMRIFLKASFIHSEGKIFPGYIMNQGDLYITIFGKKEEYSFSNHSMLSIEMKELAEKAANDLGVTSLFPIEFKTDFKNEEGQYIAGSYSL